MCHLHMSLKIDVILQIPAMASMGQYKLTLSAHFNFGTHTVANSVRAILEGAGSGVLTEAVLGRLATLSGS